MAGPPAAVRLDPVPGGTPPAVSMAGAALRERLPVWLQARCGYETRTVVAVVLVLVIALGFAARHFWAGRPEPVAAPRVVSAGAAVAPSTAPAAAGSARIVVDVAGKVHSPGVLRLPAGARVEDALSAAGGVRSGADTSGLNRARVLADGEHVVVGAPAPPAGPPGPPGAAAPGAPVSLGSATVEQLDALPGVGPVLARHIVEFRTARGGFRSVDDLRQVTGIGERRFADLRPLVRP
ncbi:ComEA family DNA-binding protein [Streptomyces bambusae]|uniref:ComEA family DNA-binding protein n=1 Tax=Streptomyces bambusae TaxID=1550616 RepID=UPI0027DF4FD0|nr:ComEA family DNA-binding protein [Streptomyces bambusae]